MRKISLLIVDFLVLILLVTAPAAAAAARDSATTAAEKAATASARGQEKSSEKERREQIKDLRERVATKVAEMREKSKRAWTGEIKSLTGTTLVLTTRQGDRTIQTSEETKFFRRGPAGRKAIKLTDLVVGEKIVVFGLVDQENGEMKARIVLAHVFPLNLNGKVIAVDTVGGMLTIQTLKRGSWIVDVETTTKILVWEKGEGLKRYGLSKIKIGDRVHLNGFTPTKPKEGENRVTAKRILVLPGRAVGSLSSPSVSPEPTSILLPSPTP